MYENPAYNENGEKILCEMKGKNAEMQMDIRVKKLKAGEFVSFSESAKETAVLLLSGEVQYGFDGRKERAARRNVFLDKPYCLHFGKKTEAAVCAEKDSKILIQQTENDREFPPVWYTPENCTLQEFGKEQWDGTAHRRVLTVFDYENAPYSNMVLGEVFHKPGCWSSYPPHYHPQPELYYYEFDKPQGFGVGFNGEACYKVEHEGALSVTPMKTHQQAAAPGYSMYYAWMIRHLDGDPWRKTRIDDPQHKWLLDL